MTSDELVNSRPYFMGTAEMPEKNWIIQVGTRTRESWSHWGTLVRATLDFWRSCSIPGRRITQGQSQKALSKNPGSVPPEKGGGKGILVVARAGEVRGR